MDNQRNNAVSECFLVLFMKSFVEHFPLTMFVLCVVHDFNVQESLLTAVFIVQQTLLYIIAFLKN